MSDAHSRNIEHALKAGLKFNYFFLGLTFSILALSLKYGIDSKAIVPRAAELIAWICLFISGIFGLLRLEWEQKVYEIQAYIEGEKIVKSGMERAALQGEIIDQTTGETLVAADEIEKLKSYIDTAEKRFNEIQAKWNWIYEIQRWSFLVGISLIMISFGYDKVFNLVCELNQ